MSQKFSDLGTRLKGYEQAFKTVLPNRMPVIIRVDGKAFHTYTKGLKTEPGKPFHENLSDVMDETAKVLCSAIQGAQMAYVQSDEISVLVHYYKRFNSEAWFDNEVQKIVSVSAAVASATFTGNSPKIFPGEIRPAFFDSRTFILPEAEVNNYFVWRQQDATRNSIQMLARSLYSHKECNNKNGSELQEMTLKKGFDWNDMPTKHRRGRVVYKNKNDKKSEWFVDRSIPIFSKDSGYVNRYLYVVDGLGDEPSDK